VASLALVNWYLCANVLVIVAVLLLAGIRAVSRRLARPIAYRHLLPLGYAISAAAVLLPLFGLLFEHERVIPHTAQVWSASTMHNPARAAAGDHRIVVSLAPTRASISLNTAARVAGYVFASGVLAVLVRIAIDALAIVRIIARAHRLQRRGGLRILTLDAVSVPFSFWIPGRYFIVVPSALILRPDDLRMAIRHEAQHHRQADTKILYLYQLARGLFYWNPAAHRLARQILELQEFACDEAVVRRGQPNAQAAYCRCLLWVAEAATRHRQGLLRVGMMGGSTSALARRIETALERPKTPLGKPQVALTGAAAVALLAGLSIAFATPIQDRRISMAEAQRMAIVAQRTSAFPITANERVLEQLNVLLGTPDGRAYLRASLARMGQYKPLISEQIERYGLPAELIAVPIVESGYRNLPAGKNPRHGAGLWMFIESTARRYGLDVTQSTDERLNVRGETEAAMRLLSNLQLRFHDWNLTLLAYNAGHDRVEQAIRETGSRDAWHLIQDGYENDRDYLARSMAVMLIMKNLAVMD